jgi:hypothetical protein
MYALIFNFNASNTFAELDGPHSEAQRRIGSRCKLYEKVTHFTLANVFVFPFEAFSVESNRRCACKGSQGMHASCMADALSALNFH